MSTIKVTNLQNASAASPAIVLDANSRATLNGLSYPTEGSLSGRNRIINGDMRIDQRNAGASVTGNNGIYAVDRWQTYATQTSKLTCQRSTTVPSGFVNSVLYTSSSAYSVTASDYFSVTQRVEGFNVDDLGFGAAGAKTLTLSFWVRSSLTGTFGGACHNNAFNRAYPFSYSISAANTWEYKTVSIAGDTTGTWTTDNSVGLEIGFSLGCGSNGLATAGAWTGTANIFGATGQVNLVDTNGATFYITGVQLEAGSVATPFERRSYGQELLLCERYFEKSYPVDVAVGANTGDANAALMAVALNGTDFYTYGSMRFRQTKRAIPTFTFYNPVTGQAGGYRGISDATNNVATAGAAFVGHTGVGRVYATSNNMTGSYVYAYHYTASAEL